MVMRLLACDRCTDTCMARGRSLFLRETERLFAGKRFQAADFCTK